MLDISRSIVIGRFVIIVQCKYLQYDLEIKQNQDLKPKEIGLLQGRDFQNKRKIIGPSIYLLCPKLPRCAKMIQDKNQPNCAM